MKQKAVPTARNTQSIKKTHYENQAYDILISHGSIWEEMGEGSNSTNSQSPDIFKTLSHLKRVLPQVYMPCPC